ISKPFWESVAQKKLSIQYWDHCEKENLYPRAHCPHCLHNHLSWKEASGNAKLKTWSIIHRAGHPAWQGKAPYVVGIVELEEGPSMLTHLLIEQDKIVYSMDVTVQFQTIDNQVPPFFTQKGETKS